jgi:ribonuclease III
MGQGNTLQPHFQKSIMKRPRKSAEGHPLPVSTVTWATQSLGHVFFDTVLLGEALSHTSLGKQNYQRLEFLGDRILGCVIADWLYQKHADEPEGKLARRFAELVRKEACAHVARHIDAAQHIRLERTAAQAKVHHTDNVLGDVCEALIGALYLDGGLEAAQHFIKKHWRSLVEQEKSAPKDIKSGLQEWAQARGLPLPEYTLVGRRGPDHAPVFDVSVSVQGHAAEMAHGTSKQDAEKRAATALLNRLMTL